MAILVDRSFVKSIPAGKEHIVLNKLAQFVAALQACNYDFAAMPHSFSIWKIRGIDGLYKFRMNDGDRILFAFFSKRQAAAIGFREELFPGKIRILILRYCCHDEAVLCGRRMQMKLEKADVLPLPEDAAAVGTENGFDAYAAEVYREYRYIADQTIIHVVSDGNVCRLASLPQQETFYYLSDEQYAVLKKPLPVFLFGCAGSGKTTLNVRKLYDWCCDDDAEAGGIRIGYFTYSDLLRKEVEGSLRCLLKEEGRLDRVGSVQFWDIQGFLLEQMQEKRLLHFLEFQKWYTYNIRKNYDAFAVWQEIRGIIKGMLGLDWGMDSADAGYPRMMERSYYLSLGPQFSVFDKSDREDIYQIAERYHIWLQNKGISDDDDLATSLLEKRLLQLAGRYDYVMIDEIQDLTEKEILLLYRLAKNPYQVFWSGDSNQTVNATYFAPHRLRTLFKKDAHEITGDCEAMLTLNYRCAEPIVALANRIIRMRSQALRKDKTDKKFAYEERPVHLAEEITQQPMVLVNTLANGENLLHRASLCHYVGILVNDEMTKNQLAERGIRNVFTVAEIKGIEKDYIVCYNLISDYRNIWEDIVQDEIPPSGLYRCRYFFNLLYVAITRARKYVCFFEEKESSFYEAIEGFTDTIAVFDREKLHLDRTSSSQEYFDEGKRLEEAHSYAQAIDCYQQSCFEDAVQDIKRCTCFAARERGEYRAAAQGFLDIGEYQLALQCYEAVTDQEGILRCSILLGQPYERLVALSGDEITLRRRAFSMKGLEIVPLYMERYQTYLSHTQAGWIAAQQQHFAAGLEHIKKNVERIRRL